MQSVFSLTRFDSFMYFDGDDLDKCRNYLLTSIASGQKEAIMADIEGISELFKILYNTLKVVNGGNYEWLASTDDLSIITTQIDICRDLNDRDKLKFKRKLGLTGINLGLINLKFLKFLLDAFEKTITSFGDTNKFRKFREIGRYRLHDGSFKYCFSTLEVVIDNGHLSGFKIHHSNGTTSSYIRSNTSSIPTNMRIGHPNNDVDWNIGLIDELEPIYKCGSQYLYQVGIEGRYNNPGEWTPLLYPAEGMDRINDEISTLTIGNTDQRIKDCLFYIICTGFHVIEFFLLCDFDLPKDLSINLNNGKLYLHKLTFDHENNNFSVNIRAYDCTVKLNNINIQTLESALLEIHNALSVLAFSVDGWIKWKLKYQEYGHNGDVALIETPHLKNLNKILSKTIRSEDINVFDIAMNWYLTANASDNVFHKFLSYCIGLEILAMTLIACDMNISKKYGISEATRRKNKNKILKCIQDLYNEYYTDDPIKFINKAYFDCIVGIRKTIKIALEKVFGKDHPIIKLFFDKIEGQLSLYDIRSKIAHGDISFHDTRDIELVRSRMSDIKQISASFIARVTQGTNRRKKPIVLGNLRQISQDTRDPRSTFIISDLSLLPNNDWKIKKEWLL